MALQVDIDYTAPPTVARFMNSEAFGRLIAGPVGSGKTTGCIFEFLRRACEQAKAPDGFRYTRFAIVRQTLKQLRDTVLKDILAQLQGIVHYKISEHTLYVRVKDVRSEWLLIPLDNIEDQRRLLSSQLTGAWMSECIEMDVSLIDPLAGRCGRFPSAKMGGCTWSGIITDTNMPEEGSDWHMFMEVNPSPEWQIFIQPGGMTADAENLAWLNQNSYSLSFPENDPIRQDQGRLYYERLLNSALGVNWVKRYVHALYGDDPSGMAVFNDSFIRTFHVVNELEPTQGNSLLIGQDFGRDPWSIICQPDGKGRLLVLEEVSAENIGLELHLNNSLKPVLLDPRYQNRQIAVVGDPAGVAKDSLYEETSFDLLKRNGFAAFPAPTNSIDARIRAVESFLLQQRQGGPALVIDGSRCPKLVRALAGGYKYMRNREGMRRVVPNKDEHSHPVDGLQYACLTALGGQMNYITRRLAATRSPRQPVRMPVAAWT